ncbi:hypothetical protein [Proteiniborus sp. MB09-C3]|uniref:hypothetical protein n=1 Tax=Proteiniborus sp. MB09-C3 TaxID=3050072 RepID=UPI00255519A6|nr:hypothetical protein [Proteiniborus sp. MB09-C3]WIV10860.1 hypothetical protein QO263_11915 [Proteiniborus sp. MB09-C3]
MPKEKKSKEIFKVILIFALVFILVPIVVFALVYAMNDNFKKSANEYFRNTPGVVGEYFSKYPTENEKAEKELFLANYYLSMNEENSADKLYIIKKSNEELFNNIIKKMNQKSPAKTKNIISSVRNIELRKDLLHTLYEEIKEEQKVALGEELKRLEGLELSLAIKEVEMMIEKNGGKEDLGKIFENMKENIAVDILYYIQPDIQSQIMTNIETKKRKEITTLLLKKGKKEEELIKKSEVYEAMDTEKAFSEIGNSNTYKIEDLSIIYMNLSIKKAAGILLDSDDSFINELISKIETMEDLVGEDESRAVKIMETINFKKQYDKKISELVALYEKMEAADIVKIVEKMMANKNSVTVFEIDENPIYTISDSSIIMDVLKNMKKQKISQILSIMDPDKAAEITRELAIQ